MSAHKTLLASVNAKLAGGGGGEDSVRTPRASAGSSTRGAGATSLDPHLPEHRELLVAFLLHCADLHNPLLPPPLSQRIAGDLAREFEAQAAAERALGLPVTVMLAHGSRAALAKMEQGFLAFVVSPLYGSLASLCPALGRRCLARIEDNQTAWAALVGAEAAPPA